MKRRAIRLVMGVVGTAALTGCADPKGAYDDFGARFTEINRTASTSSSSGGGDGGACAPMDGSSDGQFYFLLSSTLAKKQPIGFVLTITSKANASGGLDLSVAGKALAAKDRRTSVGGTVKPNSASVTAEGVIDLQFDNIVIDGQADTLITGAEIDANNVHVSGGSFCTPSFMCGSATGMATKPTALDLQGTTWAMQAMTHGNFPAHDYYDCAKDIADPPK